MKPLTKTEFQVTDNITLKLLEVADANELFVLIDDNRKYLAEWMNWLDYNQSIADSYAYIRKSTSGFMEGHTCGFGMIYQGKLVGLIGMTELIGEANLGYWIAQDMQGKGIVTVCAGFLTKLALNNMGLYRIRIRCAIENKKSRAIPERIGYTLEGVARGAEYINGNYLDAVIYSFIKADLDR